MKKKTILFGAGAEANVFSSGSQFLMDVLGIENDNYKKVDEISNSIIKYVKSKISSHSDFYPDIVKEAKQFNLDILYKNCLQNYNLSQCNTKKEIESISKNNSLIDEQSKKDFICKNPSYLGLIDSYFYTLIQPKTLGRDKFWTVILCYYRAYLSLIMSFFKNDKKMTVDYILNHPFEVYSSMKKECEEIIDKNEYYSILKNRSDLNFVTTNYTPFGQILSEDCAYLHGRFDLFESAYSRNVIRVDLNNKLPEDDLYFPYIFIQSGIKPIIEKNEIKEYNKFIEYLDDSDVLYVLGYRFNPDDSEIISMVRDYLQKEKKLIYFQYCRNDEKQFEYKKIFRIGDNNNFEIKKIKNAKEFTNLFSES